MKIQGPSSLKNQPTQSSKKSKVSGSFHTFLEAEIASAHHAPHFSPGEQGSDNSRQRQKLVEEAAALLDQALEKLSAGEKPAAELIGSIRDLRTRLKSHSGESDETLRQADAMLAVEAERIHAMNR